MLKNIANIGVGTAENEPLKVHLIIQPWDLIFTEPPRPLGPGCGHLLLQRCHEFISFRDSTQ